MTPEIVALDQLREMLEDGPRAAEAQDKFEAQVEYWMDEWLRQDAPHKEEQCAPSAG